MKNEYARIFAVACAYYLLGTIGLLWAVPPGYATYVWAPAGIALGASYLWGGSVLPGVFLGSWLVNIWVPSAPGRELIFWSGILPAIGATMQAAVGAAMMRAWLSPGWFRYPTELLRCLLIAVGSSAINGTFGPTALHLAGLVPSDSLIASMQAWWVGDSIGAAVVAPLLVFLARGHEE